MRRITCFTLFLLQTVRPLAKTAKFWRCANSAPRRPTEPLPASHHNTSVESKNIFFWILYWSHTKPSGSFPLQETMKPWASAPHADNLCKIWTRSAPISKSYDRNKLYIVFSKARYSFLSCFLYLNRTLKKFNKIGKRPQFPSIRPRRFLRRPIWGRFRSALKWWIWTFIFE